ncbi:hypothetical protein [Neptunitalea lumnitzerae]|uniref:ATP synthase F0 subunit 8 n=1 Tax=Neptunitalea lumnitzerae TaxID=2965509 RepID=A0ABQ5MMH2_9FLAO|nr:hypothetical protein [Neptunitalea sp. Y10]GLB50608.1 hypothetical protein Y10_29760 [Neptunitalea sp. Y10]
MIMFFTILSALLAINVLLLLFSVNKTGKAKKEEQSRLEKIYFKPKVREFELENNASYSIS